MFVNDKVFIVNYEFSRAVGSMDFYETEQEAQDFVEECLDNCNFDPEELEYNAQTEDDAREEEKRLYSIIPKRFCGYLKGKAIFSDWKNKEF